MAPIFRSTKREGCVYTFDLVETCLRSAISFSSSVRGGVGGSFCVDVVAGQELELSLKAEDTGMGGRTVAIEVGKGVGKERNGKRGYWG